MKGGSDRVSNLTMACQPCNQRKGARPVEEFLKDKSEALRRIKAQAKAPLKDAAAVNTSRKALVERLQARWPVTTGSGGRTKYNRTRQGYPKDHWIDAACVGDTGDLVKLVMTKGKYEGTYLARLAGIRTTGILDIKTAAGTVGASWKNFTLIQRGDGYEYA